MAKREGKLTPQQERFCQEYIIDLNASQAAIRAGYSEKSARSQASEILTRPNITERLQELLDQRSKRTAITADRVLHELLRIATVDVSEAFDEMGQLKPLKDIPEDVRRAIAGLEVSEIFDGQGDQKHAIGLTKKVKFLDKPRALELLGRHLKLFTDKVELTGKDGGAIQVVVTVPANGSEAKRD